MIRPGTLIWLCLVIVVGWAMFQVKYEVMQQEQSLARLNKQIAEEREQIRVLDAEWTYLTRPARLEQLANRFLGLSAMSAAQIVDPRAIPERPDVAGSTPTPAISPAAAPAHTPTRPALAKAEP
jgi:cell division protein FtsL